MLAGPGPARAEAGGGQTSGAPTRCTIIGTHGADVLRGTPEADVICALGGDDEIYGLGGDDLIYGGPGNDMIDAGAGNDRAYGIDGDDTIIAGPGDDRVGGGSGNDTIRGGAGNDRLFGASGDDVIEGGGGNDLAWGDGGDDIVYAAGPDESDDVKNILGGGPGFDQIIGSDGRDLIYPSADGANVVAGAGNDIITGNSADFGDVIVDAGPGDDRLNIDYRDGELQTFGLIDIDMGAGDDFVNLWVDDGPQFAGQGFRVTDDVSISMGQGDDELILMIIGLVDGNVDVDMGDGDDLYRNRNEYEVVGNATVALGEGDDLMTAQGFHQIAGDFIVTGGSGADAIETATSEGTIVGGRYLIEMYGGADRVLISEHIGETDAATLEVFLGSGDDFFSAVRGRFPALNFQTALLNPGSMIDGGAGQDSAALDSDGVPFNADGSPALPGIEVVTGTAWDAQCAVAGFDDARCL